MLPATMAERVLPTGTITFLFSDIVGSTRLVADLGPMVFRDVLEQHNRALRTAFGEHGGVERGTQGDSFLVMFRDAPSALAAAADAQRALAAAAWPDGADVRVRMGVHTGIGTLGGDDYVGLDVHRAARIAAAAHGGQVLVSDATRALAETALGPGLRLIGLGEHTLRDIGRPEPLYQLVVEGLPSTFPPPRTQAASTRSLPERVTSFIGREQELESLAGLLAANRLVTLTGPGGTGKSSLALELARREADRFANGTWWVPLESVADPALVEASIVAGLALIESPGRTMRERLVDFLADRSVLIVLDNFEHVMAAGPAVAELLRAVSGLTILVTSRAPLHLAAEQEFPVAPLRLPATRSTTRGRPRERGGPPVRRPRTTRPPGLSSSRTPTWRRSPTSAGGSTGSRSGSSWRRRGSDCCPRKPSPSGSPVGWTCRDRARGIRPHASRASSGDRLEPRSAGPPARRLLGTTVGLCRRLTTRGDGDGGGLA